MDLQSEALQCQLFDAILVSTHSSHRLCHVEDSCVQAVLYTKDKINSCHVTTEAGSCVRAAGLTLALAAVQGSHGVTDPVASL